MGNLPINIVDVVFAASFAYIIMLAFRGISRLFRGLVTRTVVISVRPSDLDETQRGMLLEKCWRLFPYEELDWDGTSFLRGSNIKITTNDGTKIEGQMVGVNDDGMICIITDSSVIAQELTAIEHVEWAK